MFVAEVYQFLNRSARHERERAAGEFEAVHVSPHRLQRVLQVPPAHRRVIRPANLSHAASARLRLSLVDFQEGERPFISVIVSLCHNWSFSIFLSAIFLSAIPCPEFRRQENVRQENVFPSSSYDCGI